MPATNNRASGKEDIKPMCLATVTTSGYHQWTMVMVHSFLKSNPWFDGDIVLITNELSSDERSRFSIFSSVSFREPSERLTGAIEKLVKKKPGFTNLVPMFWSLELFNLTGYSKVLFLDSDMLVVNSLREVFEKPEALCACAESCWYQGKGRRVDTYEAVITANDPALFIEKPINSGFVLVGERWITPEIYDGLIGMINPELWENKGTLHADQLILNLFFQGRFTLLDARYNFRPVNASVMMDKEGIGLEDACVIHYFRQYKPWNFNEVFKLSKDDMVHLKAFRMWYSSYIELLKFNHLKQKISQLKSDGPSNS
jgi:hypothetical protein